MTSVTLNWLIIGEDPYEKAFSIEIDSRKNVSILKTAIKNEISGSVPARDLKLFKVDIPLGSAKDENVIFMCSQADNLNTIGVRMTNNLQAIGEIFKEQPAETSLHILVQLPLIATGESYQISQRDIVYFFSSVIFANNTEYLLILVLFFPASYRQTRPKNIVEQPGTTEPPNKRVKIDDGELNKFWQTLKNASCKEFLELPEGVRFLGKDHGTSKLLIRKCYIDLQEVVFDDKINKLRIVGNPGIGKTFFGYYLLYLLAKKDKTIVYDNFYEDDPIVFEGGKKAFTSDSDAIKPYLRNSAVWYIADGHQPKDVNAKTILITSPKKERYWDFDRYTGVVTARFMPVWSWEEIKKCRKALYDKEVTWKLTLDLFSKWGGIPRYVLERANDSIHQNKLRDAIVDCEMDIFDYIDESCIERTKVSHMLVHMEVNLPAEDDDELDEDELNRCSAKLDRNGKPPYTEAELRFASKFVREKGISHLETRVRQRLIEQIKAGLGTPLLGSSFEYVAHKRLRNGGKFDVRPLEEYDTEEYDTEDYDDPNAKVDLILQSSQKYFVKADEIENGEYYQPRRRNFPSIDSLIAPNRVF